MRFLKGMLARKVQFDDDEDFVMPEDGSEQSQQASAADLWDEEYDDTDVLEPLADGFAQVAEAAARKPANVAASAPAPAAKSRQIQSDLLSSRPLSQDVVKIWDLFNDDEANEPATAMEMAVAEPAVARRELAMAAHSGDIPPEPTPNELAREAMQAIKARALDPAAPESGASQGPVGRTKTRVLGFASGEALGTDVFAQSRKAPLAGPCFFPVAWIVVIDGPGRGASFPLQSGVSQMGRGEGQSIQLNFGDNAISRENHASVAYDEEQNVFYIGHGGKANIVRLNGRPVLSTEEITNADMIRIGETTLRFVALCGPDFAWDLTEENESDVG